MKYVILLFLMTFATAVSPKDCVILLHGLARSSASFYVMEWQLSRAGYHVVNVDYASTDLKIEQLADEALPKAFAQCAKADKINVVSHSMGGILLRYYAKTHGLPDAFARAVMLGPPNQGSQIVDELGDLPGYAFWNGPAGNQLGAGPESLPNQLGPVSFDLGVIAGSQSVSPILSQLIPGVDDGKVSIESTKVEGMADHMTLHVTHTFMMNAPEVAHQVKAFLANGAFDR